ncbi:MAG: GNAT family N-acetyltransferase [Alphaproteobacteria bacterium]|nr:GNAT family N-acetyltransferase [Alphaproteobacteria bacterium]
MIAPAAPRTIHLETLHFILRSVEPEDVTLKWAAWLADPAKTRTLNAKPLTLAVEDIRAYLANFDQVKAHILGIFERGTGAMIGFWEVYVDWTHREFLINVLIGERGRVSLEAREETQWALHAYFFETLGLDAMRCSVVASNILLVRVLLDHGVVHEHTSRKASARGPESVEIMHFRLTKEGWPGAKALRAERLRAAPMTA